MNKQKVNKQKAPEYRMKTRYYEKKEGWKIVVSLHYQIVAAAYRFKNGVHSSEQTYKILGNFEVKIEGEIEGEIEENNPSIQPNRYAQHTNSPY
jgi:hypothetical protein